MLKNIRLQYLLKLMVFWFLFFAAFRVLFITYHHALIPDGKHSDTVLAFLFALRLDLSVITALVFIPFLLWVVQQYHKSKIIHLLNKYYNYSLIVVLSFLSVLNIKLYGEWRTILTRQSLNEFLWPKEELTFMSLWSIVLIGGSVALISYFFIRFYYRYITNFSYPIENKNWRIAQIVAATAVFVITYRGGVQAKIVNQSNVIYSDLEINNHIATNNVWYFVDSFFN